MHFDKICDGFCGNSKEAEQENVQKEQEKKGKRALLRKKDVFIGN